jgi:hypothetical protein
MEKEDRGGVPKVKPPFNPRTFATPSDPEVYARAREAWREFYKANPERWRERCRLEHATYENMVDQYVQEYGFRPDNDKLEGWEENGPPT